MLCVFTSIVIVEEEMKGRVCPLPQFFGSELSELIYVDLVIGFNNLLTRSSQLPEYQVEVRIQAKVL